MILKSYDDTEVKMNGGGILSIDSYNTTRKPINFLSTAEWACAALPLNATAKALNSDYEAHFALNEKLREMGQKHFVSLVRKCSESMISLALYAGDGIVLKITSGSQHSHEKERPFVLPSISEDKVETNQHTYFIETYPYVSRKDLTRSDIEEMRIRLKKVGMDFDREDDNPRNFRRLPDANGTLVGIDSGMTHCIETRNLYKDDRTILNQAWNNHIRELYPVYAAGVVTPQSPNTNFDFVSIHDESKRKSLIFTGQLIVPEDGIHNLTQSVQETAPPHKVRSAFLKFFGKNNKDSDFSIG